jgi:hypothetical protein
MAKDNQPREMAQALAVAVFGHTAASFVIVLDRVTSAATVHTYDFMRNDDFRRLLAQDVSGAMQVYWREILFRAHFGACASLLRTRRWLGGVLAAFRDHNYHAFMAAFRGWLEASADTFDAFQEIPAHLAEAHDVIRRALMGRLDQTTLWPDLENRLIHFSHARRDRERRRSAPFHRARQVKEYLASLAVESDSDTLLTDCYRVVCEVTHPATSSIMHYVHREASSIGTSYTFRPDPDHSLITQFCASWTGVMVKIMALGISPPVFTLRLLNEFPVAALHTKVVARFNVERRPGWYQLAERLRDPRPPRFIERTP